MFVIIILIIAVTAQAAPNNCSAQYQDALQKVMGLKETCREAVYKDCCEAGEAVKFGAELVHSTSPASGVYEINHVCGDKPHVFHTSVPALQARCSNGGWTVILRRNANISQQIHFNRTWNDYKHGFGNLNTEFWYGLRNIHCLTSRQQVDLRIQLKNENGNEYTYTYHHFVVDGPESNYTLHIGQLQEPFHGQDSMAYSNGRAFSSFDSDHDSYRGGNCANVHSGSGGFGSGWWFGECSECMLTRPHPHILWNSVNGNIKYAEMKVRSKQCLI